MQIKERLNRNGDRIIEIKSYTFYKKSEGEEMRKMRWTESFGHAPADKWHEICSRPRVRITFSSFFGIDANACLSLIVLFSASGPRSVLSGIEAEKLVG